MSALSTDYPSRPGFARHLRMTAVLRHPGMTEVLRHPGMMSRQPNNVILRCERSEPRRMQPCRALSAKGDQS